VTAPRPFRFIAPMPRLGPDIAAWTASLRRIEDLGFETVAVSEHLTHGWSMEPLATLAAAAMATSRVRLLTLVLANDFRHPVMLHKAAATIDVLSGGRLDLGLGAGWLRDDYDAAGIAFDRPGVRIERLAETIAILDGLFGPDPFTFTGRHFRVSALEGLPRPIQSPRPRLFIGGGGPQILGLAGRHADIVGIHARLAPDGITPDVAADLSATRFEEKIAIVRAAAADAGRPMPELQATVYLAMVGTGAAPGPAARSSFASALLADAALLADSPAVLMGSVDQCVAALIERRERFGISAWHLGGDLDAVAPIVARLAGR
jgi:probable F420-dependent oxidoreductase